MATDFELAKKIDYFLKNKFNPKENKTELCQIMTHEKSDKGDGCHHNYTQLYYFLFQDLKNEHLNIFELGIGSNDITIEFNMGVNGVPGASLRGWRSFFPNSTIVGADIDKKVLIVENRIKTYYVDQLNSETIKTMWSNIDKKFDIILDDGLHRYAANINFLKYSFQYLKPGGFYIIEDISLKDQNVLNFYHYLLQNKYNGVIVKLPNQYNNRDNCLIIIKK